MQRNRVTTKVWLAGLLAGAVVSGFLPGCAAHHESVAGGGGGGGGAGGGPDGSGVDGGAGGGAGGGGGGGGELDAGPDVDDPPVCTSIEENECYILCTDVNPCPERVVCPAGYTCTMNCIYSGACEHTTLDCHTNLNDDCDIDYCLHGNKCYCEGDACL